jgi:hypothetical protein
MMSSVQLLFCDAGTVTHRHFLKLDFYVRKFCFCYFRTLLYNSELTKSKTLEIRKLFYLKRLGYAFLFLQLMRKTDLKMNWNWKHNVSVVNLIQITSSMISSMNDSQSKYKLICITMQISKELFQKIMILQLRKNMEKIEFH